MEYVLAFIALGLVAYGLYVVFANPERFTCEPACSLDTFPPKQRAIAVVVAALVGVSVWIGI